MRISALALLVVFAALTPVRAAEILKCIGNDGQTHYSAVRMPGKVCEKLFRVAPDGWALVNENEEFAYFRRIDFKRNGGFVSVWTMTDHKVELTVDGMRYRSVKSLMRIDCEAETIAVPTMVFYSGPEGSGDVVSTGHDPDARGEPAVPDTIGHAILESVCVESDAPPSSS